MEEVEPQKTPQQGCSTMLVAALDPSLDGQSGAFLRGFVVASDTLKPHALDETQAARLWALSEELVRLKFLEG